MGLKMILSLLIGGLTLSTAATAQPGRMAIACSIEGSMGLIDSGDGKFTYIESVGFMGSGAGKRPATVIAKKGFLGTCTIEATYTISNGTQKTVTFTQSSKNHYEFSANGVECDLAKRYQESFAKCIIPTAEEPGNKCYGESASPYPITLSNSTFANIKIDLNQGGIAVTTRSSPKDQSDFSGSSFSGEKIYVKISNVNEQWCVRKSEYETDYNKECKFIGNRSVELKNDEGKIVGVISASNNNLVIAQVKAPFSNKSYKVDSDKPALQITFNGKKTEAAAVNFKTGAIGSKAKVQGDVEDIDFSYGAADPIDLSSGRNFQLDCNGASAD